MCYNPISIVNPTKYVSVRYRDRFLLSVPCGHCAQCQRMKSNEWYFRSYYQALETLGYKGNKFVLFDTLTYRDEDLPHISNYIPLDNKKLDFPCFNSSHLRHFVTALRNYVKRKFGSNFTFFITSEYGTSERRTHRPHYHLLAYVTGGVITPLQMSAAIAKYWKYGRTDGIPYKSPMYVMSNTFQTLDASTLRTCRYVSKYVQKSCKFDKEISRRIDAIMFDISKHMPDDWLETQNSKYVRQRLNRLTRQFHRQSTGFGAYALETIDLNDLYKTGSLVMPDSKDVRLQIGLPIYYKRKLFYKTIIVDGNTLWIPTEEGEKYLKAREKANLIKLSDRYSAAAKGANLSIDSKMLADYTLNYRGRINVNTHPSTIYERLQSIDYYNYVTPSDKQHLGSTGLTLKWCGNNTCGYNVDKLPPHYRICQFIKKFVYLDDAKEKELSILSSYTSKINDGKQSAIELREKLVNKYHYLSELARA